MTNLDQFLIQVAFVQMLSSCLILVPKWTKDRAIFLFSLLLLCGSGYHLKLLFGPITSMGVLWWLGFVSSNALPGVFWLVSLCVFGDYRELQRWQYSLASLTLIIPLSATLIQLLFNFDLQQFPAVFGLVTYGALSLELILICHAMVVAMKHWQADLVEARRFMRGGIIALTAIYLFGVIVVEQILEIEWQRLQTVEYLLLCLLTTAIMLTLFTVRRGTLFGGCGDVKEGSPTFTNHPVDLVPKEPVKPVPSPELKRVLNAMEVDKLYREEGMTITTLSQHLSIHEYRLRKLINGELAYRNFNDFLNFFRIQEVSQKLSDPQHQELPVLTLALDSGFRSLSSFNKAFKNIHGVTPTEYRAQMKSVNRE